MKKNFSYIIIGSGSSGLVIAIGLARAKKDVLLIEKGNFGGDCTNYGCIPSKSIIASAKAAHFITSSKDFGIGLDLNSINLDNSLQRTRNIVEEVRSTEDKNALEKHGVTVLQGKALFLDKHTLNVETGKDSFQVLGKKIIIATGSSPKIPEIENLHTVDYLTNESVFELKKIPQSLIVLGGGPIGAELAQTFQRLGAKVSLVHSHKTLLTRESEKTGKVLKETFENEGIQLFLSSHPKSIDKTSNGILLKVEENDSKEIRTIEAEKILIATGRKPNIDLDLEKASIDFTENGISTNAYKQTSQKHIYAVGDCSGPPFFTHLAEHQARTVLQSLLLFRKKVDLQPIPRVTYTDPEVATIGLTEEEALPNMKVYYLPFSKIDRAVCEGKTNGFITIVTKKWSSKILGATIVGPHAGELLMEIALAMKFNISLRKLNKVIHAYPIYSRGFRKISDLYLTETLLSLFKK